MGRIFGISNRLASAIAIVIRETKVPQIPTHKMKVPEISSVDTFLSKENKSIKSNPFIKMRNGVGKLMSHFQHPKQK